MITVSQMMPAAQGMYLIDKETKTATLVVMWVLVNDDEEQQILGLTNVDLSRDLEMVLEDRLDKTSIYSSRQLDGYKTIR